MKNKFKMLAIILASSLFFSCMATGPENEVSFNYEKLYSQEIAVVDTKPTKEFSNETAAQIVDKMKFGWNLGNTLDAHSSTSLNAGLSTETCWGQPKTTQAMIQGIKDKGFNTIRIPITWHGHFEDKNYTIDPDWMNRVKEIVDWSIDAGLYVIINIHHDNVHPNNLSYGKGYAPSSTNKNESMRFLYNIWCQITTAFNNGYDEHLIFETMNEPRLVNDQHEWNWQNGCPTCKDTMNCINEFNQMILNTIRASGGNNAKRLVMVPSAVASPDAAFNSSFKLPTDSVQNKLILSAHMYTPYDFAMKDPGDVDFTQNHKNTLDYYFRELNSRFASKGIPVVIGEMGATNKNNLEDRKEWFSYFLGKTKEYKMAACLWDNGHYKIPATGSFSELYGYYNRNNQSWFFPGLVKTGIDARN